MDMKNKDIYSAIIEKILSGEFKNDKDLTKVKLWACKEYNLDKFPSNSEILSAATTEERKYDQFLVFIL
jgi:elongator complex protein 3